MKQTSWARVQNWIPLFAALLMFVHAFVLHYTPDDAFISFRYAINIARGYGPVFNYGQHVEGYTSPLWVFALGALKSIGLPIEPLALILSISAAVLAVLVLPLLSWRLGYTVSGVDALLLAANTSFAVWAGASMEMTVFAFVLVLATFVFVSEQRFWLAGLLFGILALVRPEGLLFGLLGVLFAFWRVARREHSALRDWLALSVMFVVPVLAHLLWRLSYYGYPLPNTFYDKVGSSVAQLWRGIEYIAAATWQYVVPLSLPLLIGLTTVRDRKRLYVAVGMTLYLAYVAVVGGDFMVSFRLVTLVMPFIVLFAASGWLQIWQWAIRSLRVLPYSIVAVLGVLFILVLDFAPSLGVDTRQEVRDDGEVIAGWLNEHCPTNLRLAVYAAGAIAYYAPDFQIVDMFGLNKEDIAHMQVPTLGEGPWAGHEKFSAPLTLKENPNIFVFNAALDNTLITTADGWQSTPLEHLTRQFTDDINFWADHSTQTAPMPNGKHFNFVVLNPYPCK